MQLITSTTVSVVFHLDLLPKLIIYTTSFLDTLFVALRHSYTSGLDPLHTNIFFFMGSRTCKVYSSNNKFIGIDKAKKAMYYLFSFKKKKKKLEKREKIQFSAAEK